MSKLNIFNLPPLRLRLTIDEGVELLRNLPMENFQKINIYKGITNEIELSIRNNDRKAVSMFPCDRVLVNFVSSDKATSFHGYVEQKNIDLGLYTLIIPKEQLLDVKVDTYKASFIVKDYYGKEVPLYLTQDYYPFADVVVCENNFEGVIPTIIMDAPMFRLQKLFIPHESDSYCNCCHVDQFTSRIFKSDRVPTHTFMFNVSNFYGTIFIEGSNDDVPSDSQESWFVVGIENYAHHNPAFYEDPVEIGVSGNLTVFKRANCLWMRIRYIQPCDSVSRINKVYYRN